MLLHGAFNWLSIEFAAFVIITACRDDCHRIRCIIQITDILVQINPAQEESKFGVSIDEAGDLVKEILENCENIRIKGLMSVAPIVEDPRDVKPYFDGVKAKFDELAKIEHPNLDFKCLSMGMSHDFQVAIEAGSNLVRVGSAIFGERDYELYRKQQAEKKAKKQEENR